MALANDNGDLVPRHSDFDRLNESGTKWANAHGADSERLIGIFARIDFKESKSLCRGTSRKEALHAHHPCDDGSDARVLEVR
jgi:hypothetical protein